jgi:hypothetical protein
VIAGGRDGWLEVESYIDRVAVLFIGGREGRRRVLDVAVSFAIDNQPRQRLLSAREVD